MLIFKHAAVLVHPDMRIIQVLARIPDLAADPAKWPCALWAALMSIYCMRCVCIYGCGARSRLCVCFGPPHDSVSRVSNNHMLPVMSWMGIYSQVSNACSVFTGSPSLRHSWSCSFTTHHMWSSWCFSLPTYDIRILFSTCNSPSMSNLGDYHHIRRVAWI